MNEDIIITDEDEQKYWSQFYDKRIKKLKEKYLESSTSDKGIILQGIDKIINDYNVLRRIIDLPKKRIEFTIDEYFKTEDIGEKRRDEILNIIENGDIENITKFIRTKTGTLKELAKDIGMNTNNLRNVINRSKSTGSLPRRGYNSRKLVNWLLDRGYVITT